MDAYELYHDMQDVWRKNTTCARVSSLDKFNGDIKVCVWTSEGYKEITRVKYNKNLHLIELELEE